MRGLLRWIGRLLLIGLVAIMAYQMWLLAHIWYWVDHNPTSSAFMDARAQEMRSEVPPRQIQFQWVDYAAVSPQLKRALVASEDAKFLAHDGFDWEGIEQAYNKNLKKGRIVAGGSTISQQLAKNLFLTRARTPWRKAQEALITLMIERMMTKRRILEIYMNVIEWGDGIFGAQAAAIHYFGVDARRLTAAQAARLAAMVPNPRYYDRHRNARGLLRKAAIIQSRMRSAVIP